MGFVTHLGYLQPQVTVNCKYLSLILPWGCMLLIIDGTRETVITEYLFFIWTRFSPFP